LLGLGLVVTVLGFLIALLSLDLSSSVGVRLVVTLIGLAVSLFGIIGLVNRAYVKNAIWKR
jgi:hypothetical protein